MLPFKCAGNTAIGLKLQQQNTTKMLKNQQKEGQRGTSREVNGLQGIVVV